MRNYSFFKNHWLPLFRIKNWMLCLIDVLTENAFQSTLDPRASRCLGQPQPSRFPRRGYKGPPNYFWLAPHPISYLKVLGMLMRSLSNRYWNGVKAATPGFPYSLFSIWALSFLYNKETTSCSYLPASNSHTLSTRLLTFLYGAAMSAGSVCLIRNQIWSQLS